MQLEAALQITPGLTCIIGGGGKTSLLYALGQALSKRGSVVLCATAKMYPFPGLPFCASPSPEALRAALKAHPLVCVGDAAQNGKITLHTTPIRQLLDCACYVLAEADGSRQHPLKAHAPHEPVIPEETSRTIVVLGVDGVYRPIHEAAHRPALYAGMLGVDQRHIVSPLDAARALNLEGLGDMAFINKVHTAKEREIAREIQAALQIPGIYGALEAHA